MLDCVAIVNRQYIYLYGGGDKYIGDGDLREKWRRYRNSRMQNFTVAIQLVDSEGEKNNRAPKFSAGIPKFDGTLWGIPGGRAPATEPKLFTVSVPLYI